MSAMIPMALFGLEVPAGDVAIPALSEIPSAFRITMAAIDPSAEPEPTDEPTIPRATLKVIRQALVDYDSEDEDEDESDFDINQMEAMLGEQDDDEDSDDEDVNGGPSDPARSKKAKKAAAQKAIMQLLAENGDDDDDMELDDAPNGKKSAKALGKMPASDDDEDEDSEDSDDEEGEIEEFVICTLDPAKNYQQPIDITIGENERVFFKVSGTHSVYLTGNYVEPAAHDHGHSNGMYDPDSDEEDDYDLEPNSDEEIDYDSEDELDDIEDPRITEIEEEEEAPELVKASKKADKKGKNKRPAEEDEAATGASIDELIAKAEEKPLSKKQLKKLKKNDGSATETKTEEPASAKSDKKVSFAKQLEQGPTPTKADAKKADDKKPASSGPRVVQGVTIDDKKLGTGPAAKAGDKVGMRYIGKLEKDGKVFDSNKKGKPFTFKLGVGEVIKGWDIGVAGMTAGGERRITIPAHLGYGKQGTGPIPGNANLVFDVKLLSVAKK